MDVESSPEEMGVFFDTRAAGYEAHMAGKPESRRSSQLLEAEVPATSRFTRILDLGCGMGSEIEHILKRQPNAQITCVDLSKGMLDLLRKKYSKQLKQLTIVQASYFDYDFGNELFDAAVACMTMHHWLYPDKQSLYRRIHMALKAGGYFIDSDYMVSEAMERSLLSDYFELQKSGKLSAGRHYHIDIPFSVKTETQVLTEAGFSKVSLIEEGHSATWNTAMIVAAK